MKTKILHMVQASMLLVGVCVLGGCFERQYYGSPGYGYGSGYSAPYAYQPSYYPPTYTYQEYRPAYRYNDGTAWRAHERVEARQEAREEHREHERHEAQERHEARGYRNFNR